MEIHGNPTQILLQIHENASKSLPKSSKAVQKSMEHMKR